MCGTSNQGGRVVTGIVWTGNTSSEWRNSGNWSPEQIPQKGDAVTIPSGAQNDPVISGDKIYGLSIALGNAQGGAVTLTAQSVTFVEVTLVVSGGDPSESIVQGTMACSGSTTFGGSIMVTAPGGSLTIDAGGGAFTLADALDRTMILVSQESALAFSGGSVVTAGVIEIDGHADVAAGVTIGGSGLILLEAGGCLSIEGSVEAGQLIVLADPLTAVVIANPAQFLGALGLAPVSGASILFLSLAAQSLAVDPSGSNYILDLFSAPNGTGDLVAKINVVTVDEENFAPNDLKLTVADFVMSSDPAGTVVTYAPGGLALQQSIPAPIVEAPGSTVPLTTIFQQAFGVSSPPFLSVKLMYVKHEEGSATDQLYWQLPAAAPQWRLNGKNISEDETVAPAQWGEVSLLVGNNISVFPQFQAQVASASPGPQANYVLYTVWTVPPEVFNQVGGVPGAPTPQNVVDAANAFFKVFPKVPNTNLCNWIADNVAAAAGAPMPLPDAQLDPANNVSGGFWRIAYTGQAPDPEQNWSSLVQPGDIVRMRWIKTNLPGAGGHSTTVVAGVENGEITVYDNVYHPTRSSGSYIGEHQAAYWNGADPASISIYRLDPLHQYLIEGGGGVIQGSCYNNLIRPGVGATVITAGAGNNEIQGSIENLNNIEVSGFHAGDVFDFTDLDPASAKAIYASPSLTIYAGGQQVASINLTGLASGSQFSVKPDGSGGTLVALAT
jgi:hypothetical protein